MGDGKKRSTVTTCFPYHCALYSNCRRNSPQLASEMDFARVWFFPMFFGAKSSDVIANAFNPISRPIAAPVEGSGSLYVGAAQSDKVLPAGISGYGCRQDAPLDLFRNAAFYSVQFRELYGLVHMSLFTAREVLSGAIRIPALKHEKSGLLSVLRLCVYRIAGLPP